jgi:hypothetical protein
MEAEILYFGLLSPFGQHVIHCLLFSSAALAQAGQVDSCLIFVKGAEGNRNQVYVFSYGIYVYHWEFS